MPIVVAYTYNRDTVIFDRLVLIEIRVYVYLKRERLSKEYSAVTLNQGVE